MAGTTRALEHVKPKVSIVVCTRNRADYLPDCLKSLTAQNFAAPFEIIVVDNASTDSTPEIIDDWCQKDSRVVGICEPRVGLSVAKNTGVRLARGQLLLFTDDDVIVQPNWINTYAELFSRGNNCSRIAGGRVVPVPADMGAWPWWFDYRALVDIGLLDHQSERRLTDQEWVWGANLAVPTEVFAHLGCWNENVGRKGEERGTFEDVDFQDRVRRGGGEVWFCPDAVVHHRVCREEITPRRVLNVSFARGLSGLRKDDGRRLKAEEFIAERFWSSKCIIRLCYVLSTWMFLACFFAAVPSRRVFEKLRFAVWSSGWSLAVLSYGNSKSRFVRLIRTLVFTARRHFLSFTSDGSLARKPVEYALDAKGELNR